MICPWLKSIEEFRTGSGDNATKTRYETFNPCYDEECPWYRPSYSNGSILVAEECMRAKTEYMAVKNGNDKR